MTIKRCKPVKFSGEVLVTDPGYVFPDTSDWKVLCRLIKKPGYLKLDDNYPVFVCNTAYGDGRFLLRKNNKIASDSIGVDSGMLSVIPKKTYEHLLQNAGTEPNPLVVKWINIKRPAKVEVIRRGDWKIAEYMVITS